MGWATMYNGAWDYPADTRGYTWGWMHEFHARRWSVRYASVAMPKEANGLRFDRRLLRNRGDVVEGELRGSIGDHAGTVRARVRESARAPGPMPRPRRWPAPPDVTATRRDGTRKYGFGLNADQEIRKDIGIFGRLGWNDGKTESFAFTAIDRLATAGVSVGGLSGGSAPTIPPASSLTLSGLDLRPRRISWRAAVFWIS